MDNSSADFLIGKTTPGMPGYQPPVKPGAGPDPIKGSMTKPPVPQQPKTPPPVGGNQPPVPTSTTPFALSQVMSALESKVQSNNALMTQRQLLLKHLYDQPLTDAEKQQLDPTLLPAVNSGDRNQIDMRLRLISDQIAGRNNTLDQSIQYLTTAYKDTITQAETQRQDAMSALKDYMTASGDTTAMKNALSSVYGPVLKGLGIDPDSFFGSVTDNNTNYSTANDGNPLNITLGPATQKYVDSGQATVKTANGLKFLSFKDPAVGLQAAQTMLFDPKGNYASMSVDAALKKWSGGGYGGDIVKGKGVDPNAKIGDLPTDQRAMLVQAMAQREGGKITSSDPTAPGTTGKPSIDSTSDGYYTKQIQAAGNLTQAAIDQAALKYALTGTMPSIGLSSTGQGGMRKNAILNRAGELEGSANIEGNKVKLASLSSSLNQQTTYLNTMERSINTVDDNLELLMSAADKVNSSDSPLVNEWTNLANQKVIGSGDLSAYKAAIQTVRTEYGNILSRGGVVTVNQQEEAKTLIPDNISKAQLQKVIGVLKAEGANVKQEAQNQVDSIANDINQIVAPTNTSGGAKDNDPMGIR